MATILADFDGEFKWTAYAGASVIAWSRVEVRAHRWRDVTAGAALGYYTAKYFTRSHLTASHQGLSFQCRW
jgi:membrane-associated phospholipid phosphatase